jgi:hypothetical protein
MESTGIAENPHHRIESLTLRTRDIIEKAILLSLNQRQIDGFYTEITAIREFFITSPEAKVLFLEFVEHCFEELKDKVNKMRAVLAEFKQHSFGTDQFFTEGAQNYDDYKNQFLKLVAICNDYETKKDDTINIILVSIGINNLSTTLIKLLKARVKCKLLILEADVQKRKDRNRLIISTFSPFIIALLGYYSTKLPYDTMARSAIIANQSLAKTWEQTAFFHMKTELDFKSAYTTALANHLNRQYAGLDPTLRHQPQFAFPENRDTETWLNLFGLRAFNTEEVTMSLLTGSSHPYDELGKMGDYDYSDLGHLSTRDNLILKSAVLHLKIVNFFKSYPTKPDVTFTGPHTKALLKDSPVRQVIAYLPFESVDKLKKTPTAKFTFGEDQFYLPNYQQITKEQITESSSISNPLLPLIEMLNNSGLSEVQISSLLKSNQYTLSTVFEIISYQDKNYFDPSKYPKLKFANLNPSNYPSGRLSNDNLTDQLVNQFCLETNTQVIKVGETTRLDEDQGPNTTGKRPQRYKVDSKYIFLLPKDSN